MLWPWPIEMTLFTSQYNDLSDMINELDDVSVWPYETRISFSFVLTWRLTFLVPLFEVYDRLSKLMNP